MLRISLGRFFFNFLFADTAIAILLSASSAIFSASIREGRVALSVGHPRGTHSRYVIGCCLIPLGICGLKNNSRRVTYGIGCVWGMPSLFPLSSLDARIQAEKLLITAQPIRNLRTPASAEMNKRGSYSRRPFPSLPYPPPFFPFSLSHTPFDLRLKIDKRNKRTP